MANKKSSIKQSDFFLLLTIILSIAQIAQFFNLKLLWASFNTYGKIYQASMLLFNVVFAAMFYWYYRQTIKQEKLMEGGIEIQELFNKYKEKGVKGGIKKNV